MLNRWMLIVLSCLFLIHTALMSAADPLAIGAKAPGFSLPGVDGKTHSLSDYVDAELLVLVFTCNHCPTAQAYEERIKQLVADYRDQGVAVVAISPNDPQAVRLDELGYTDLNDGLEDMKLRAKEKGFTFPYLFGGDHEEVMKQFGPQATPHVFVFDSERILRYQGRIDNSENPKNVENRDTRNAIDALLNDEPVPVETTKTFGCSVKYSDKRKSVTDAFERWAEEEVTVTEASLETIESVMKNDSENLRLVNVWATFCGPCVAEFPDLVEINRMYRHREFEMITISADTLDNREKVLRFLENNEASMTNLLNASGDPYALIEAVDPEWSGALPYTVLIRPGGEILYRHTGIIDPLVVKRKIVGVLGRTYH